MRSTNSATGRGAAASMPALLRALGRPRARLRALSPASASPSRSAASPPLSAVRFAAIAAMARWRAAASPRASPRRVAPPPSFAPRATRRGGRRPPSPRRRRRLDLLAGHGEAVGDNVGAAAGDLDVPELGGGRARDDADVARRVRVVAHEEDVELVGVEVDDVELVLGAADAEALEAAEDDLVAIAPSRRTHEVDVLQRLAARRERLQPPARVVGDVEPAVRRDDALRHQEAARRVALAAKGAEEGAVAAEGGDARVARVGDEEGAVVQRNPLRVRQGAVGDARGGRS